MLELSLEHKVLERGEVRRVAGQDLPDVLATNYFSDSYHAVAELVANSFDACAKEIRILYNPDEHALSVIDDGEGMDLEEVKAFYRLGDSPKRKKVFLQGKPLGDLTSLFKLAPETKIEVEEKGKRSSTTVKDFLTEPGTMGKWGLASIAVMTLATSYEMKTRKGSRWIDTGENFHDKSQGKAIKYTVGKNAGKHGTELKLHLRPELEFIAKQLEKRLVREMPLTRDTRVYINDTLLVPLQIKSATPFKLDEIVPAIGRVHGMIYLSKTVLPEPDRGIRIRVNGRVVGGNRVINVKKYTKGVVADRICGDVEASGLDNLIGIDRSRFNTGHVAFILVEKVIGQVLGAARRAYEHMQNDSMERKKDDYIDEAASMLESRLNTLGRRKVRVQANSAKAGPIATLDEERSTVYINPKNVSASMLPKRGRATALALVFETYAAYAMAKAVSKNVEELEARMQQFFQVKADKPAAVETVEEKLNRFRMYNPSEIHKICSWGIAMQRRLIDAGLVDVERIDNVDRVSGTELLQAKTTLDGYMPVYELFRIKYDEVNPSVIYVKEQQLMRQLNDASKPEYIKNVSKTDKPFYVVHISRWRSLDKFINTGKFPKTEKVGVYSSRKIGSDYLLVYTSFLRETEDYTLLEKEAAQANQPFGNFSMSKKFTDILPANPQRGSCLFCGAIIPSNILAKVEDALKCNGYTSRDVEIPAMRELHKKLEIQQTAATPLRIMKHNDTAYTTILGQLFKE